MFEVKPMVEPAQTMMKGVIVEMLNPSTFVPAPEAVIPARLPKKERRGCE